MRARVCCCLPSSVKKAKRLPCLTRRGGCDGCRASPEGAVATAYGAPPLFVFACSAKACLDTTRM